MTSWSSKKTLCILDFPLPVYRIKGIFKSRTLYDNSPSWFLPEGDIFERIAVACYAKGITFIILNKNCNKTRPHRL